MLKEFKLYYLGVKIEKTFSVIDIIIKNNMLITDFLLFFRRNMVQVNFLYFKIYLLLIFSGEITTS